MSTFLKFLDISSFFIIIVINLSLIALLCYYVKRKFEHVEEIQNQQAKILFVLVNKPSEGNSGSGIDSMFLSVQPNPHDLCSVANEVSGDENKKVLLLNDSEMSSSDYKTFFDEKKDDETTLMDEESEGDSDSESESDESDSESESEHEGEIEKQMVGVADKLLMSTRVEIHEEEDDDTDIGK